MPITVLKSKGQMTIPREVRNALHLKPSEKVIIVVEGEQAVLKPLRGTIFDIGGSVKTPVRDKPVDFKKVRHEVRKQVAQKAVARAIKK